MIKEHWLRSAICGAVAGAAEELARVREISKRIPEAEKCEYIDSVSVRVD